MTKTENFDQVHIAAPEQLWDWLSLNHAQEQSVWLVTWKKRRRKNMCRVNRFWTP